MTEIDAKVRVGERGQLAAAMREVKTAMADRDDVVIELREAARMRLELLAQELEPVFADVPTDDSRFDFAISQGLQPRLWIDAVAHVGLGRDRRTYRFVLDTRLGRTVLAESTEIAPVAQSVTRYIAERLVERERSLEGDVISKRTAEPDEVATTPRASGEPAASTQAAAAAMLPPRRPSSAAAPPQGRLRSILSGLGVMAAGAAVALAVLAAIYWDRIAAYVAASSPAP